VKVEILESVCFKQVIMMHHTCVAIVSTAFLISHAMAIWAITGTASCAVVAVIVVATCTCSANSNSCSIAAMYDCTSCEAVVVVIGYTGAAAAAAVVVALLVAADVTAVLAREPFLAADCIISLLVVPAIDD
jgi:hypothetical protein